ncbi:cell division protein ZapA [Candidatus Arthromitus sp. SFB-rat-Yit]|uniref:cell division protein ZapA n=1 Tax=Candidatus Arthromitus sp. SFB-rat-Yit TaxID=1041504 RepID=UPI000227A4EA|nr:cell division protein ZapA [Candidatus Arthromitus sp. SFB-rat-Yit]BAK80981.1 hypothetical protein RATSFB_0419 [Candidatus Arthromitus sp. SFB-rat-Yit]
MNIVTININGIEYKLKGEESEEYLNNIAREVDDKIKEMMTKNVNLTAQSSSILLAINYCDQLYKYRTEKEDLNNSIENCNVKIQSLIDEKNELKERMIHIESENSKLKLINKNLEEEIEAYNTVLKEDNKNIFSDNNEIEELEKEIELLNETVRKLKEENVKLQDKLK